LNVFTLAEQQKWSMESVSLFLSMGQPMELFCYDTGLCSSKYVSGIKNRWIMNE
jgi:hypothetical protein